MAPSLSPYAEKAPDKLELKTWGLPTFTAAVLTMMGTAAAPCRQESRAWCYVSGGHPLTTGVYALSRPAASTSDHDHVPLHANRQATGLYYSPTITNPPCKVCITQVQTHYNSLIEIGSQDALGLSASCFASISCSASWPKQAPPVVLTGPCLQLASHPHAAACPLAVCCGL